MLGGIERRKGEDCRRTRRYLPAVGALAAAKCSRNDSSALCVMMSFCRLENHSSGSSPVASSNDSRRPWRAACPLAAGNDHIALRPAMPLYAPDARYCCAMRGQEADNGEAKTCCHTEKCGIFLLSEYKSGKMMHNCSMSFRRRRNEL